MDLAAALDVTRRLSEARDTLRRLYHDRYEERIEPARRLLRGKPRGPLATALEFLREQHGTGADEMAILHIAAAAVDVCEEENPPAKARRPGRKAGPSRMPPPPEPGRPYVP